jgi:hypothetical protein
MKIIITPAVREQAVYVCDLTGEEVSNRMPMQMTLRFGYGSGLHDGEKFEFHFSKGAEEVLIPFLRTYLLQGESMEEHRVDITGRNPHGKSDPVLTGHDKAQALDNLLRFLREHGKPNPAQP